MERLYNGVERPNRCVYCYIFAQNTHYSSSHLDWCKLD
jgi:hypothetical protein